MTQSSTTASQTFVRPPHPVRASICLTDSGGEGLLQNLRASWQRSLLFLQNRHITAAPLTSIKPNSLLQSSLQACLPQLRQLTDQTSMVLAVADVSSAIIWTQTSQMMRRAAEKVHFVVGGQWSEEQVGTNALALSLKTGQACCVISDEHLMESVHDWVCYAAPIRDPFSHRLLGVIDLSTKLKQHNNLGVIAAEHCAHLIQQAVFEQKKQSLQIQAGSAPKVMFNGKTLSLTPRQLEILAILSLHPQGLALDQLHQALYGDRPVTQGTLKAEISQLRHLLNGMLGSRPYRLLVDVDADFLELERLLDAGHLHAARQHFNQPFFHTTTSPFLQHWQQHLEKHLNPLAEQP